MIAFSDSEKRSLKEVFLAQCPKATPDPEFLSNLYDFDVSMCPHRPWERDRSEITEIFMEIFDAINSSSRVPELFVWMQGQVCRTIVIFVHFH